MRARTEYEEVYYRPLIRLLQALLIAVLDRLLPLMQQANPPNNIVRALAGDIEARGAHAVMAGATMRVLHGGWHTCFVFGALRLFGEDKRVSY